MRPNEVIKFLRRGTPRSQRMLSLIGEHFDLAPKKKASKPKPKPVATADES